MEDQLVSFVSPSLLRDLRLTEEDGELVKIIIRKYNIFVAEETIINMKKSVPKAAKKRRFGRSYLGESDSDSDSEEDDDLPAAVPASTAVPAVAPTAASAAMPTVDMMTPTSDEYALLNLYDTTFPTAVPPTAQPTAPPPPPPTAPPIAPPSTSYQQIPQILMKYLSPNGHPMCGICKVAFRSESEVRAHLRRGCLPESKRKAEEWCNKCGELIRSTLANVHLHVYKKDCLKANKKREA